MVASSNLNSHMDVASANEALRICEERLSLTARALQRSEGRAIAGCLALEVMHEIRNPLEALGHLIYLAIHEAEDSEGFGSICSWPKSRWPL